MYVNNMYYFHDRCSGGREGRVSHRATGRQQQLESAARTAEHTSGSDCVSVPVVFFLSLSTLFIAFILSKCPISVEPWLWRKQMVKIETGETSSISLWHSIHEFWNSGEPHYGNKKMYIYLQSGGKPGDKISYCMTIGILWGVINWKGLYILSLLHWVFITNYKWV